MILSGPLPLPSTNATTMEPLLFENIGQLVSGLSYVHTHIPINISQLESHILQYRQNIVKDLSEGNLRASYRAYMTRVMSGPEGKIDPDQPPKILLQAEDAPFMHAKLASWAKIGTMHLEEVEKLQQRVKALYLTLPISAQPNHRVDTQHLDYSDSIDTQVHVEPGQFTDYHPSLQIVPLPSQNLTQVPRKRSKRFIPLIVAGIAAAATMATAGTAFGVINKNSLETLTNKIKEFEARQDQVVKVLENINQDTEELRVQTRELVINSFVDQAYDSGLLLSKLRTQLQSLKDYLYRIECAIQQAQHHRLAINYLSPKNLLTLFQQVKAQAKSFGYQSVIERPSELFQLDVSYMFDGRIISLLLHVPIAPPDAFMRLFRLHPFPLPFDNGTLLTHNVKNEILAISNSNHRFTLQMSTVDLLGCHRLGKLHLCERNGLLNKYPEDTCLGSLYHQKFDIAHQLCNFRVEPAREFIYQLLHNWFMVFEPSPLTVPVVCANGSHSELHVRRGISKFHLTAGCTADFPRYRLLSDISILIPQDYIQLEMDWDPVSFLPGIREFLIPEIRKLGRMGATTTSLATLQSMVASRLDDVSGMFHWIHFGFNGLTVFLMVILVLILGYRCFLVFKSRQAQDTARQVDLAVRTALNRTGSNLRLNLTDGDLSLDQFDSVSNHLPRVPSTRYVGQCNRRSVMEERERNERNSYQRNNLNDSLIDPSLPDDLHLKYPTLSRQ